MDDQIEADDQEESEPKLYYVHNDIVFIAEYVSIDSDEPLEIIQCHVDVGEEHRKIAVATR
jgi:hypothetical protein